MVRKTITLSLVAGFAALLSGVPASTAQAQYRYGFGNTPGYSYEARTSRYPRANFDDYYSARLRQRRIQQYYGTPYYPALDNSYYGRQQQRSYLYRPDYDGRQFRSRHDDFRDRYDDRYDGYRDNRIRSRYRFGY